MAVTAARIAMSRITTRVLVYVLVLLLALGAAVAAAPPARAAVGWDRSAADAPAPLQAAAASREATTASATPAVDPGQDGTGEVVSLLDGDDADGQQDDADGEHAGARTDVGDARADGAVVEPAVSAALAESGDEVAVIIHLLEQADLDRLASEAARDGRAAANRANAQAQARRAPASQRAREMRQAAHEARVSTVVDGLRRTATTTNHDVAALLAQREAAGQARGVTEYWIFNGFAATVDQATLDDLAAHPDVASITLDDLIELPEFDEEPRLPSWSVEAVSAPDAWGEYGIRGDGVVVGVLDTGVDVTHPALAGSYRGRDGDHTSSWYVATGENYPTPGDGHGHGTHVAGSIAGGPPGEVVGVAPGAEWIGVKLLRDTGSAPESAIRDGMQWILAPGGDPTKAPHVVNNSWGNNDGRSTAFWNEVEAWVAAGIFPVFANGNVGPGAGTVGSPASFPHSFGVGATDRNDVIADFSSRGPAVWDGEQHLKPQVSAPGHQIRSAWPLASGMDYRTISGTSMAAPHVAGVAALALSAAPGLTVDELRNLLQDTARSEPHMGDLPNHNYGHGIVDAFAATTRVTVAGLLQGTVTGPDGPIHATIDIAAEAATTTTDPATGDYQVFVREGTHDVTITAYGYLDHHATVTITAGDITTLDAELQPAPTATLQGLVTSSGGPVARARVTLVGTPLDPIETADDGTFALTVAHGRYTVRATAHGYAPGSIEVTVDADTSVQLTLSALEHATRPGWAQYQNNPARTGFTDERVAPDTFVEQWTAQVGGQALFSSPVIADGRVYLTTDNGRLHAIDADAGTVDWTFTTGAVQRGTPAVTDDAVFVTGGDDSTLYALDPDEGEVQWTYGTPGERLTYSAPAYADGTVYLGTGFGSGNGGYVHAVDAATGQQRWRTHVGPQLFFGPAVADGMVVAVSRETNRISALDATTGDELWTRTHSETFLSMPTIADGAVYLATSTNDFDSGSVLALDAASGDTLWHTTGHGDTQGSSPVLYGDLVIVGSHVPGTVAAYDRATGQRRWIHAAGSAVSSAPLVTAGGVLLGGSQLDHRIWALDASTGELLWDDRLTDNVLSAPAAGDGLAVFADRRGTVRAYASTGTVTGTVTGPDGPLDATIRVAATGEEATTDPDSGTYELTLRPGTHTLEFRAYGYDQVDRTVDVEVARTATVDVTLDAVGIGAVTGAVTDGDGAPIEGATVAVHDTPLEPATTATDGTFSLPEVAAGTYAYTADADGYAPAEGSITITAGETTTLDVTLVRFDVAVVADHQHAVSDVLEAEGWLVDAVSFAQIDGTVDRYQAVVLSGSNVDRADADLARFARIVEQADDSGTSLVLLDQWSLSYGSIRSLFAATAISGELFTEGSNRGRVWLEDVVDHPITASLPDQSRVTLLTNGDHAWFTGYSGYTLARLGADQTGQRGGGLGYERRTLDSNHILLPVHAPTPWAGPALTWEPVMRDLLTAAIDHAVDASYGAVSGRVTNPDGEPLPADVEVVDGIERTRAATDGGYELLLEPGTAVLRFRALGHDTVEREVDVVAGETLHLDVELPPSGLGTVAGTVTDEAAGSPIAGATVTVVDTDVPAATTQADGTYTLAGVPGGTYDVAFKADGYLPLTVEKVEVVDGAVTTLDAAMESAPVVAVVGDRLGQITQFLVDRSIPAFEVAGWDIVDQLDGVDVVVLQNPPDISNANRDQFLAHLAAFDEAGVSVIFPADGWSTRTRGFDLLVRHTGDPASYGRLGGISGPPIYLHDVADHPIFAGLDDDPLQLMTGASEAAFFPSYSGIPLASVALDGAEPAGLGVAYSPRTPDSVHLLLTGLSATLRNVPEQNWTPQGQQIFLNAVRWAASPQLSAITGTVTDPDDEPVAHATVDIVDTPWSATTDEDGAFAIGVPAGDYTLATSAFGYLPDERDVSVGPNQTVQVSIQLPVAAVGAVEGIVTTSGIGDEVPPGTPLAGVEVQLTGTPLVTTTDEDGRYAFRRVEPGDHELLLETDGHVRTFSAFEVEVDATTTHDVQLRASPRVGIIDDSGFTNSRDRGKAFLEDWGYLPEDIGWDDLEVLPELDVVVANISSFPNPDPGADGFAAFEDAVNRAGIPVLWMDMHGRGAIQYLRDYTGDPAVRDHGFGDGAVTAHVVERHPLVAGLPDSFDLMVNNGRYAFFDEYGGTTVATLSTGADGHRGSTIAYRGRTASTVDVLLSTLTVTTWGAPATPGQPRLNWTPEAERVYVNALAWALEAEGLGAEVRGTVQDETGARIASRVEVLETGRTYTGRAGDGTFVVPLDPGTWTLEISSFAYETTTYEVTVAAGDIDRPTITLAAGPAGTVVGTVTDTSGTPIAGATARIVDTARTTTTGANGSYSLEVIPEGDWTVEIRADGYMVERRDVTVADGAVVRVDATLEPSRHVAVAGDHADEIRTLLEGEGYAVDQYAYNALNQLEPVVGDYDLVVLNGQGTQPSADMFTSFVDAAAEADTSLLFTGMHARGSIRHLTAYLGDPESVTANFAASPIYFEVDEPHPIFAGVDISAPIELMRDVGGGNQQYMYYTGYSGETIAQLDAPGRPDGGNGVGFRFASAQSVHLLLTNLMATPTFGFPTLNWTDDAIRIYLNAVAWAIDASQGEIVGTVTSGGAPVAGAQVGIEEAGVSATTASDGTYRLGVPGGTHTVEVTAHGYAPVTTDVTVEESEVVQLDVELERLPRGAIEVVVTDAADDAPIEGATVTATGPSDDAGVTDDTGSLLLDDLLPGDYLVEVAASGYVTTTAEVVVEVGETTVVDVPVAPNDVAIVGDVDGAMTRFLQDVGVAAEERSWTELAADLGRYEVVVVNGGQPSEAQFTAVVDGADAARVSLVFTGTWGVDRGGIRLLERFTADVRVGGHGFRDGRVSLGGFDPDHPLFAGIDPDDNRIVADDGYYSWLDGYVGHEVADLALDGEPAGVSVAYDFRGRDHVHVLLSAGAVTELIGPGYGWTEDTARLVTNAIAWAAAVEQPLPGVPTLETDAPEIGAEDTIEVYGVAEHRTTVSIVRDGEELAMTVPDRDGSYRVEVALVEGANELVAEATNFAGTTASAPLTMWLDTIGPVLDWTPQDGEGFLDRIVTVAGTVIDEPAGVASMTVNGVPVDVGADGSWSTEVTLGDGTTELTVVATDTVGNTTTESRTIAYVPFLVVWEVPPQPARSINVRLHVTDLDGVPTAVDLASLEAVAAAGTVAGPFEMRWADDRYQHVLQGLPSGEHALTARLEIDGFVVTLAGPTVQVR